MIYLDNSATTRVLPEAANAAYAAMTEGFYNPSGAYSASARVEKQVEEARRVLLQPFGNSFGDMIFTSGGTESNNMAVFGTLKNRRGPVKVITTEVEHPSVYESVRSLEKYPDITVVLIPVDGKGYPRLDALSDALTEDTALVSLMHVNNELGVITPLEEASRLIRSKAPQAVFHVDGVQAYLKVDTKNIDFDLYSISAHKFHAPKGFGALYKKKELRFAGGQIGGGQEQNLRSGTLNVPGILGSAAAVRVYLDNLSSWRNNMYACKRRLYENLSKIPEVLLNGPAIDEGAPHILNLSFMGVRGEVLLHALEQKEIYVSTGSACSSRKKGKNRILTAAGILGARQEGAIRFSLCPFNTVEEMDSAAQAIFEQVAFLRKYRRR